MEIKIVFPDEWLNRMANTAVERAIESSFERHELRLMIVNQVKDRMGQFIDAEIEKHIGRCDIIAAEVAEGVRSAIEKKVKAQISRINGIVSKTKKL